MGGKQGSLSEHPIQCFHGTQDSYQDIEATETFGSAQTFKYAKITRHSSGPMIQNTQVSAGEEV